MSRLEIEFEWIAPEGGKGAELRATWARFGLRAGSEWVTRVEDLAAHSVRTGIYGPLYPLAEWLAVNWWSLLHEVPTPRKEQGLDYRRRHCIDAASEGFALPSLSIRPEGSLIALEWEQKSIPSARISFISNGRLFVDVNDLEDTLRSFILAVIARLKECGVTGTLLEQEWDAVESADSEEKEFCLAVGRLGGDPYSADGQDYLNALAEVSRCLPGSILDEFFAATVADRMVQHATVLAHLLSDARTEAIKADTLSEVKSALSATLNRARQTASTTVTPWETGYEVARELRAVMGADPDWTISNKRELSRILRTNPDEWLMRLPGLLHSDQVCQAVVAPTKSRMPRIAVGRKSESGVVFAVCRALYEYLVGPDSTPALVTEAYSERQKCNRAFAAEFIAPSQQIRQLVSASEVVTESHIQALAEHFGTSELVIFHQIRNHRIAFIKE